MVVGPKEVVGRHAVDPDLATTALECVDDDHALVDDRVVEVDDLWRDVVGSALGGRCPRLALICPSWWGSRRLARVLAAGRQWCDDVVVLPRAEVWSTATTVVELGPELVVVHADGRRHAIARATYGGGIVAAVVAHLDGQPEVTVDVPAGLALLGADLVRALRGRGVDVAQRDDRTMTAAVGANARRAFRWPVPARTSGLVAATLTAGGLVFAAVTVGGRPVGSAVAVDASWVVEGRVAVEVPVGWTVDRVTSGPGSARVQVSSPGGDSEVIHVTQSRVPDTETLDSTGAALAAVLTRQPDGVFVDFTASGERAGRRAVSYREVRPDRRVDWTVLLDGGVRIAIGCQGAGDACDRAIRSAHAVTRK